MDTHMIIPTPEALFRPSDCGITVDEDLFECIWMSAVISGSIWDFLAVDDLHA